MDAKISGSIVATLMTILMASACYGATLVYYSNIVPSNPVTYNYDYYGVLTSKLNRTGNLLFATYNFTVNVLHTDAYFTLGIFANKTISASTFQNVTVTANYDGNTVSPSVTPKNWTGVNGVYCRTLFPYNVIGYNVRFHISILLSTAQNSTQFWLNAWVDNGVGSPIYYSNHT